AEPSAIGSPLSVKVQDTPAGASVLSPNKSEIETRVILDGEVDRNYVAELEGEARSGQAVATQNAAMAHHVASQFEIAHGEMDLALADERTALTYAPQQLVFLMNVAYLYLRRSQYTQ